MFSPRTKLLKFYYGYRIFSHNFSTPQEFKSTTEITGITSGKPARKSFMKNIFVGTVDEIFFQYPDPKINKKSEHFQQSLIDLAVSVAGKSLSTYDKFRVLIRGGMLKCRMPENYGGVDMTFSDVLRLYEKIDLDPSLSHLLETQSSLVLQTILQNGSEEIKEKYLTKVVSGEWTGSYAISEEESGSDPTSIKTCSVEFDDCFKLSGQKIWVTNADQANFFLVFADNILDNKVSLVKDLSVFLVEKSEEISIEKHNMLGLNDCGLCKLKFKDLEVPKSNLIGKLGDGFQIAGDGFTYQKYVVLIAILNKLKYFISSSIAHVQEKKIFPVDLKDCELVKKKLTDATSIAYVLESMLYLTSGILDHYTMDDSLESGILQAYGFEKGFEAITLCMDLMGSKSYDLSYPFEKLWRDLKGATFSNKTIDIVKMYIALIGMDHAGKHINEVIRKNRNPFDFPGFVFRNIINNSRQGKDKPKLTLKLYMNLHPRLKNASEKLEYCILRFKYVIELLLTQHGSEVTKRQLELKRVADIAIDIYAMVAILSRSSKSYCTGVQFSDQEINLTNAYCYNSYIRVKNNVNEILETEKKLNDMNTFDIGSHIIKNSSYSFEHPLKPNIV